MPAKKKSREWLLSIPLVAYWAVLFIASMYAEFPDEKGESVFPLMILGGLPIFILAARAIIHPVEVESDLAYIDDLTGVANRRAFLQHTGSALKRARPASVGLIVLDVRGLKQVNDRCGHQAGDELLVSVARRFETVGGKLYRIGGDEFAVLVRRADGETVSAVTRSLDEPYLATFETCGHQHEVRVSYGMTSNRTGDSFEPFFRRADDMLVLHKRQAYKTGRYEDRRGEDHRATDPAPTGTDGNPPHLRLLG
jgi:diguanylate cyclase (GGDEF)-like protein